MASSDEPLEKHLSTAGYDKEGYFYRDIYQHAVKVKNGTIIDERFYSVMFELEEKEIERLEEKDPDYWKNPELWARVNPNLGISPTMSFMHGQVAAAENSQDSLVAFKTKHLNMWMDKALTWIESRIWNNPATFDLEDFKGCKAYYGLDLASTMDLTCLTLLFQKDDKMYVYQKYYIPENNVRKRVEIDRVPYLDWIKEGHIITTEGDRTDYARIEKDILELNEDYPCDFLGYDDWNANYLITRLQKQEIECVRISQTLKVLSPATKELEVNAISKKVIHNNNPVLNWCVSNVVITMDDNESVRPSKKKSIERIDGVASLLNAIVLYIINKEEESTESHYEENGLIDLD